MEWYVNIITSLKAAKSHTIFHISIIFRSLNKLHSHKKFSSFSFLQSNDVARKLAQLEEDLRNERMKREQMEHQYT